MTIKFPICNRRPDRAPKIFGYTFILCWRCTGILIGVLFSSILDFSIGRIFILPLAVDGIAQYVYGIESTNLRRFITGFLAGMVG